MPQNKNNNSLPSAHFDDCFAPQLSGPLMRFEAALQQIEDKIPPAAAIIQLDLTDKLGQLSGHVLAEDIHAPFAVPRFDNSAVDGYALFADDLEAAIPDDDGFVKIKLMGRMAAGDAPLVLSRPQKHKGAEKQGAGKQQAGGPPIAALVFTGAGLPQDQNGTRADIVFMREDAKISDKDNSEIYLPQKIRRGANIRRQGEDQQKGQLALTAGTHIGPIEAGVLASLGIRNIKAYAPLRVALFSSGNEIQGGGEALRAGGLYDVNRPMIGEALAKMGMKITDLGIIPDQPETLAALIDKTAQSHDLIISSGGMSAGDEDHISPAINGQGHFHFWRLAIKPGRPIGLGLIPRPPETGGACVHLGLPGNVVAAFTCFQMIGKPLIRKLAGARPTRPQPLKVQAGFAMDKKPDRREFLRVRLCPAGQTADMPKGLSPQYNYVVKAGKQGSGILSTLAKATGFLILPEDMTSLAVGDMVDYLDFDSL